MYAGVRIITRQLAKCEWISGMVSKNTNPLASLARDFSPSLLLSIFLASCFQSWRVKILNYSLASVLKNLSTPLMYVKKQILGKNKLQKKKSK
jgi:hypothetical protein